MCLSFWIFSVELCLRFQWRVRTFVNFHLNITFADNELVENEEGEDDGHGEGDEAKLEGVDLYF